MTNPLNIPPLDAGRMQDGVRVYDLTMQNGTTEFFPGFDTPTRGINGSFLAPTLNMRRDEAVRINVRNDLGEPSTLDWHGMHLPASQDGGPHQVVPAGASWSPEFTVKQSAASLWYHPHLLDKTAEHVWSGLAGMIIVNDDEADALELPNTYGVDDVPIVLQDRFFSREGRMDYRLRPQFRMIGMVGDVPLVNGTYAPYLEASTNKLRLRILNGSNASTYTLAFDTGQTFQQIATDGGLLEAPVSLSRLTLVPGERAEIVVDLEAGRNIMLRNIGSAGGGMMMSASGPFDFLEIRPAANLADVADIPSRLASIDWLRPEDAARTRHFDIEMAMGPMAMLGFGNTHTINGKSMDMARIDERVSLGDTEIWSLRNVSMIAHPIHIHDVQFQILDRNGRPPAANERGRKDVVLVEPGETVRVIMRFEDYSDPDSPFMYHCHILEHEDAGMMGQFVVV
ncbi:MAG: multicopper oxidase family protein [Paracoccaceae bacterium]